MQTSVDVSLEPKEKEKCQTATNGVSYTALMTAFMALAQLNGQSKQVARKKWLNSPQRAKSISEMSNAELCRRRLGPYANSRKK